MNDINTLLPDVKLRFNIDHPDLEECYGEGYQCAVAEGLEDNNPYAYGTIEHEQWSEGWWAGFYGEEPLFNLEDEPSDASDMLAQVKAANDQAYHPIYNGFMLKLLRVTGALAATAVVGYQVLDLVA